MLQNVLQGVMDERKLSARDVAKIIGVSHTTVIRALQGAPIDLTTLLKLAEWLGIRPSQLLDSFSTVGEQDSEIDSKIAVLVEAYPDLMRVFEEAATAVQEGRADPAIIKDIVSYAQYRLSTGG